MSDNKLVKAITTAATLTGLVAGIGWIAKSGKGWQRRAKTISRGSKDSPRHRLNNILLYIYVYTYVYIMASIAIMIGGAVVNAASFIGGNYLAQYLTGADPNAAQEEKHTAR